MGIRPWPQNPTKKLTHLVNILGHLLSPNHVSNYSDLVPGNLILIDELKGEARKPPKIFRVVLAPCAQFCLCEASKPK